MNGESAVRQSKVILCGFVATMVMLLSGCPNLIPSFTEGIRVFSYEEISGISNSNFPLPNVSITGAATAPGGPGNTGNLTGFTDSTNALRYLDEPQATTSTTWNFSAYFGNSAAAAEDCPPATQKNVFVPAQGAEVSVYCFVFSA